MTAPSVVLEFTAGDAADGAAVCRGLRVNRMRHAMRRAGVERALALHDAELFERVAVALPPLRIRDLTAPRTVVLVRTDAAYLVECLEAARGDAGLDAETGDYRARLGAFAGRIASALEVAQ